MTDTDLFTAGGSDIESPDSVKPDVSEPVSAASADAVAPEPPQETAPAAPVASAGRGGSLTGMVLPDLRALANQLSIKGASGMRKSELIAAIREHRGETNGHTPETAAAPAAAAVQTPQADTGAAAPAEPQPRARRERRSSSRQAAPPAADTETKADAPTEAKATDAPTEAKATEAKATEAKATDAKATEAKAATKPKAEAKADVEPETRADHTVESKVEDKSEVTAPKTDEKRTQSTRQDNRSNDGGNQGGGNRSGDGGNRSNDGGNQGNRSNDGGNQSRGNNNSNNDDDDDGDGRQGRRGRRFRDRRRRGERTGAEGGGGDRSDRDTELREDDVVQPVAGILDVLDNYAFVRTSGYLAGPNDVYVSMNMVRKNGLRRGDAVTGAVRIAREGEGGGGGSQNPRQKFNPLVRLDTINGGSVEDAKKRPEFQKLTPLYPNQRLRLETTPDRLTTRVIDLIMPIGKGQRALIVSPPKAGKTMILQSIANAITTNNPECHLMVVLVDERPEEVTDMQRSVKGEVIASTFDRPPSDHTAVAELAIERAKRLVEQGSDVVVLLDSITRLGRAYNNASPASGRILSGGVDSTALYPPKRFLGAARNIEDGGSLTIIATAMVETGSTGDTVIFEEFKGTGNAELKLDRKISERRVFPAVDVNPSGTRKDELLLSPDEFSVVHKLRRVLSGLDSHQAIDLLMSQLRKAKTNYEFLVQVSKTTPGNMDSD